MLKILLSMTFVFLWALPAVAGQVSGIDALFDNENREQIEISRFYERLPKPTLIAIQEFEEDKIYYRKPEEEKPAL